MFDKDTCEIFERIIERPSLVSQKSITFSQISRGPRNRLPMIPDKN